MNTAFKILTALSAITLSIHTISEVRAQPVQSVAAQSTTVSLLQQEQAKAKRGDYEGAIADYTKAIQANPKLTAAYISAEWLITI